jgi:hypothetical protein
MTLVFHYMLQHDPDSHKSVQANGSLGTCRKTLARVPGAVFAEFERAMIRERVMAGLSRAKADGIQLGRRRLEDSNADKVAAIVAARAKGTGIRRIARDLGVGVGTVLRVTGEPA